MSVARISRYARSAQGRRGNTDALGLAAAGVVPGKEGVIVVDEHFRTTVPHIRAAGDIVGAPALASTSMQQAKHARRHAFGTEVAMPQSLSPTGIYTIPDIRKVGMLESSLVRDRS